MLEECSSLIRANAAEAHWIAFYRTQEPGFGFNIRAGGLGTASETWKAETLARRSASQKAIAADPAEKQRRSIRGKKFFNRPDIRAKAIEANRENFAALKTPEFFARVGAATKRRWEDPVFRKAQTEKLTRARRDPEDPRNVRKSSKHAGVSWDKLNDKWVVRVRGKNLGRFSDETEATRVAEKALLAHRLAEGEDVRPDLQRLAGHQDVDGGPSAPSDAVALAGALEGRTARARVLRGGGEGVADGAIGQRNS